MALCTIPPPDGRGGKSEMDCKTDGEFDELEFLLWLLCDRGGVSPIAQSGRGGNGCTEEPEVYVFLDDDDDVSDD